MKSKSEILITGTRLEIAASTTKHSVGGRSNNRRGRGVFLQTRLAPRAPLQKTVEACPPWRPALSSRARRFPADEGPLFRLAFLSAPGAPAAISNRYTLRLEIAAIYSKQRRRHFSIATKTPYSAPPWRPALSSRARRFSADEGPLFRRCSDLNHGLSYYSGEMIRTSGFRPLGHIWGTAADDTLVWWERDSRAGIQKLRASK
jgi:hypothetical protein